MGPGIFLIEPAEVKEGRKAGREMSEGRREGGKGGQDHFSTMFNPTQTFFCRTALPFLE